ncbi:MAG: ribonucleoside-diphosphate reductase subunit alpha, partial [Gammaproteobacteria bacterium]|nr:ribonucleoside-diphosphate reductase subunit alpha [Gammaproteobacteria bacterium]
IDQSKDYLFNFLGLQTLFDRYFIHWQLDRFELPQAFFMRIAMGLALNEQDKNDKAIQFYNLLSTHTFMSSTPTLFNSGTLRSQLSSCYLTTVSDDLDGIYSAIKDNANLSKYAGGLGNDWTNVRGCGSHIKGTNGVSSGVIPFLNVADATAVAVNQGGKRKGAVCAYLETWHLDIEEFLELRKNTGDDRRRTHDMNTANWVPDLFMERVHNKEDWTLFSPFDAPDLHGLYGDAFKKRYEAYEALAKDDKIQHRVIPAMQLWRKMLSMIFETGHPWMTFKDPCNLRSPQQHVGVVNSSNLCTEITLNTSKEEIAVCNLGSINLSKHFKDGKLDETKLKSTIEVAIRMLDNVIDINYYAVETARNSNMKHRPIGMGLMGFQDALYIQGIPYDSPAAVKFADECMELISYHAILASSRLAEERGTYESYKGSLWDQGILPVDSIKLLKNTRPEHLACQQDDVISLDWDVVRKQVTEHGVRNSNIMAIAPTATIANICGVSQSIEPTYQNLFVKSNLSGEFTMINEYLIEALKKEGLWDEAMVNDLKYFNGDLTDIQRVPESIKAVFKTAFQIEPEWLIDCASKRQKWIDQAQSLNLYINQPSGKKLDKIYKYAWMKGLKTTYYLRSLGASAPERATVTDGQLNAVPKQCSIDDPDCEACQ